MPLPRSIRASSAIRVTHTIDLGFEIVQGPRVYIEKINISGNTRTLDKVIRREFRLVEGDAFNRVLVDRSRTRIRGLGFFKDVEVKNMPGSQPDRTNLTVRCTEQSTGSLSVGLGYSSDHLAAGRIQLYRHQLVRPRPESARLVQVSQITKQAVFSFTEPYFLDRDAGGGLRPVRDPDRLRAGDLSRATPPPRCCAWAFRSPNIARWR